MDHIKILNTNVHLLSVTTLHEQIKSFILNKKKATVDYLNIYSANLAVEHVWFKNFLNSCDLVLCDGKGIQLAASLLGQKIPEQIAYNRWLWDFFTFCQHENYSIFFLGSQPEIVEKAMDNINRKGYRLKMDGHHGYFDKTKEGSETILRKIDDFQPDILLIGFGMPIQEKWVLENYEGINSKVIILGGAYLDWISGSVAQTPRLVSNMGLEWLYRLILEPKRLYGRYLIGIPKFFMRVFTQSVGHESVSCN